MVVLSASILTRNGKILIARQFIEISRLRLEGLLSAFPKLLASETTRQHTFIDTESVRYVYHPIENFFILLITNKSSNLVEDIETENLIAKIIPDMCGGNLTEDNIRNKQFELVFALDEIISPGGYCEHLSISQLKINLEMESHEEKLHQMIQESKQVAAKDEMKRQQIRIRDEQREKQRLEKAMGMTSGRTQQGIANKPDYSVYPGTTTSAYNNIPSSPVANISSLQSKQSNIGTGMKLGGLKKSKNLADAMAIEDDLKELPSLTNISGQTTQTNIKQNEQQIIQTSNDPIVATIEEKLTVQLNREGTIDNLEIKGSLYILANDQSVAACSIRLQQNKNDNPLFSYQTHPKINKKLFESSNILALKDTTKPFPNTRVGVLRWGIKTTDESYLPLTITCWPESEGDGKINVNIEYTLEKENMELQNVDIMIPLGCREVPHITDIDGTYVVNSSTNTLIWHNDIVDQSNKVGSLEFTIQSSNVEAFFPLNVTFSSKNIYSDLKVINVVTIDKEIPIQFSFDQMLSIEAFIIQ